MFYVNYYLTISFCASPSLFFIPILFLSHSLPLSLILSLSLSLSISISLTLSLFLSLSLSPSFSSSYNALAGSKVRTSSNISRPMGATILGSEMMTGGTRTINSTTSTFLNQEQNNSNHSSNNDLTNSNGNGNANNINNTKKNIKNKNKDSGKMIKRVFLFSQDPQSIEVLASEGDEALIMWVIRNQIFIFHFLTLLAFTFYLEQYLKVDIIFNIFQLLFFAINFAIAVHQLIVFVSFVVYLYRCLLLDFDAEGEGAADLQVTTKNVPHTWISFDETSIFPFHYSISKRRRLISCLFVHLNQFYLFLFYNVNLICSQYFQIGRPKIHTGKLRISVGEDLLACAADTVTVLNLKRSVRAH